MSRRASDRGGSETILVVDDRPEVAEVARVILEDHGYTVIVSHDPREALVMIDEDVSIDLLFSDLIMSGGLNSVMLARIARERRPTLKVLLTTGYAEASLERTDAGGIKFEVINKSGASLTGRPALGDHRSLRNTLETWPLADADEINSARAR